MSKHKKNLPTVTPATEVTIAGNSPVEVMKMGMNKNMNLADIEKMLVIQEKWDALQAKKAYTLAMTAFKENPPTILKDKLVGYENKDGSLTGYKHASLGNVTNTINAALAEHSLSAAWKTEQNEDNIIVTCTITHRDGYSENTQLKAPADQSGKKNFIQAIGSTITYLERYTLLALTGLATHDQDNDGRGVDDEIEYISDQQKSNIVDTLIAENMDEAGYLKWLKVESVDKIPANSYQIALNGIETVKNARAKEKLNDNNK